VAESVRISFSYDDHMTGDAKFSLGGFRSLGQGAAATTRSNFLLDAWILVAEFLNTVDRRNRIRD